MLKLFKTTFKELKIKLLSIKKKKQKINKTLVFLFFSDFNTLHMS